MQTGRGSPLPSVQQPRSLGFHGAYLLFQIIPTMAPDPNKDNTKIFTISCLRLGTASKLSSDADSRQGPGSGK